MFLGVIWHVTKQKRPHALDFTVCLIFQLDLWADIDFRISIIELWFQMSSGTKSVHGSGLKIELHIVLAGQWRIHLVRAKAFKMITR